MGDSNTITVDTELGVVNVRKMPLRDYAELLRALESLPQVFSKFTKDLDKDKLGDMNDSETFDMIREVLTESWDDLIKVIAVPTDQDAELIGKLDGADAIDVIDAILELNDIPRIIAAVKKMLARRAKMVKAEPQQS